MNVAILLSGGVGTRLGGDIPKQYIEVGGKPVIYYTMKNILNSDSVDALVVVASDMWTDFVKETYEGICEEIRGGVLEENRGEVCKNFQENNLEGGANRKKEISGIREKTESDVSVGEANPEKDISGVKTKPGKDIFFASPGRNRQESIIHALEVCDGFKECPKYVMVHDAVRPFLTNEMIDDYFAHMSGDGLLPVLPMKDTVYISQNGKDISSLIDRSKVFAGQAPEIFDFKKYLEANKKLSDEELLKINGSTEPAVMAGMNIQTVPGDEKNFKITTKEDLRRFEAIISGIESNS